MSESGGAHPSHQKTLASQMHTVDLDQASGNINWTRPSEPRSCDMGGVVVRRASSKASDTFCTAVPIPLSEWDGEKHSKQSMCFGLAHRRRHTMVYAHAQSDKPK